MRIVIDIDGTICETKKPGQEYHQLRVNPGAAEKIKALKVAGHFIILQTARHMKTMGGDVQKVIEKIGPVTKEWLKKHGIPYDEIHFGKPYNQVIIDDRAFVFEGWRDFDPKNFESDFTNILITILDKNSALAVQANIPVKPDIKTRFIFLVAEDVKLSDNILNKVSLVVTVPVKSNRLQATMLASEHLDNFQRVIIMDGNNMAKIPSMENIEDENLEGLLTIKSGDSGEGYIKNDEWGFVAETSQNKISEQVATGFYFFNNGRDFLSCARAALRHGRTDILGVYDQLIARGQKVKARDIN